MSAFRGSRPRGRLRAGRRRPRHVPAALRISRSLRGLWNSVGPYRDAALHHPGSVGGLPGDSRSGRPLVRGRGHSRGVTGSSLSAPSRPGRETTTRRPASGAGRPVPGFPGETSDATACTPCRTAAPTAPTAPRIDWPILGAGSEGVAHATIAGCCGVGRSTTLLSGRRATRATPSRNGSLPVSVPSEIRPDNQMENVELWSRDRRSGRNSRSP